ncbi:MAG: Cu(I)-responsive transcriptional regulator [Rhodospirillales bacterium]
MNIGQAAERSGVPAKTIRYYESIGLIPPAGRLENGYRDYDGESVRTLHFIHRSRKLGFSLSDIGNLLTLWQDKNRASAEVKRLALSHIEQLDARINELEAIRRTLIDLTRKCHGDARPDCPILDELGAKDPQS